MRKIKYHIYCLLGLLLLAYHSKSQVTISGPPCAIAGSQYEYTINGTGDSASTMQVCINNGLIHDAGGDNTCSSSGKPVNVILVMWNDSASDIGSISVTSTSGNASFNVNFTQPLLPGLIDTASKTQLINYHTQPNIISCLPDSGGSCSPAYNYQWQQSLDQVNWQDITAAISNNLVIDSPLIQSTYYRRKVTETVSGSIGYSDAASVFVIVMPDSTSSTDSTGGTGYLFRAPAVDKYLNFIYQERLIKFQGAWMMKDSEADAWPAIMKYNNNA